jgi:hypothetical protein
LTQRRVRNTNANVEHKRRFVTQRRLFQGIYTAHVKRRRTLTAFRCRLVWAGGFTSCAYARSVVGQCLFSRCATKHERYLLAKAREQSHVRVSHLSSLNIVRYTCNFPLCAWHCDASVEYGRAPTAYVPRSCAPVESREQSQGRSCDGYNSLANEGRHLRESKIASACVSMAQIFEHCERVGAR